MGIILFSCLALYGFCLICYIYMLCDPNCTYTIKNGIGFNTRSKGEMSVTKIKDWGGHGGGEWSFVPQGNGGITKIIIRFGLAMDSISFVAQDGAGNCTDSSNKFGGNGGSEHEITLDWPREYLTSISGTVGDLRCIATNNGETVSVRLIKSLELSTNHGRKYGPFGRSDDNDTPFNFKSVKGSAIVGFHGRCGSFLDSIGVYVGPTPSTLTVLIRKFGPLVVIEICKVLYRWTLMVCEQKIMSLVN